MPAARAERAPAKINLTLRVVGRRADGYHDIESLVVFAGVGDTLTFAPARALALTVDGPTAAASGAIGDNLVLKAARALAERVEGLKLGRFALTKRLPVAAGVGGGSSDAAAALRLLARANRIALDDPRLMEAARRHRRRRAGVPRSAPAHDARHRRDSVRPAGAAEAAGGAGQSARRGADQGCLRGARAIISRRATSAASGVAFESRPRWKMSDLIDALAGEPQRSRSAGDRDRAGDRACARRPATRSRAAGSRACRARARPASACSAPRPRPRPPRARCAPNIRTGGSGRRSWVEQLP